MCGVEKIHSAFPANPQRPRLLHAECIECRTATRATRLRETFARKPKPYAAASLSPEKAAKIAARKAAQIAALTKPRVKRPAKPRKPRLSPAYSALSDAERELAKRLARDAQRLRKFGLTRELYERQLAAQERRCAICKRAVEELQRELAVDHDHTTGAVRGLLCMTCNAALGMLRDSEKLLRAAIEYLRRHRE